MFAPRLAVIQIVTGSQRFQVRGDLKLIARFESQGQKLFESLLRLYYFHFWLDSLAIHVHAVRDSNRGPWFEPRGSRHLTFETCNGFYDGIMLQARPHPPPPHFGFPTLGENQSASVSFP